MFKVNNKDTRTTPMASYFTPCSSVYNVNFEHITADWVTIYIKAPETSVFTIVCMSLFQNKHDMKVIKKKYEH